MYSYNKNEIVEVTLQKIIENLHQLLQQGMMLSQIEKDLVLQNLRDAYLLVLSQDVSGNATSELVSEVSSDVKEQHSETSSSILKETAFSQIEDVSDAKKVVLEHSEVIGRMAMEFATTENHTVEHLPDLSEEKVLEEKNKELQDIEKVRAEKPSFADMDTTQAEVDLFQEETNADHTQIGETSDEKQEISEQEYVPSDDLITGKDIEFVPQEKEADKHIVDLPFDNMKIMSDIDLLIESEENSKEQLFEGKNIFKHTGQDDTEQSKKTLSVEPILTPEIMSKEDNSTVLGENIFYREGQEGIDKEQSPELIFSPEQMEGKEEFVENEAPVVTSQTSFAPRESHSVLKKTEGVADKIEDVPSEKTTSELFQMSNETEKREQNMQEAITQEIEISQDRVTLHVSKEEHSFTMESISENVNTTVQKTRSLNDLLTETRGDHSLNTRFQNAKIQDLTKSISINDKFLFIRELFKNRGEEFSTAIQKLNSCQTIEEAFEYMDQLKGYYLWDSTSPAYLSFCDLIRRKF